VLIKSLVIQLVQARSHQLTLSFLEPLTVKWEAL